MKTYKSLQLYVITTVAIYFSGQSVYLFFSRLAKYSQKEIVTQMETFIVTALMLCQAMEIFFVNSYTDSYSRLFRGELFGYQDNLINKYTGVAAFRGKQFLKGAVKCVYNVNELHEKPENSFRRGALENKMEESTKYIGNDGTGMMKAQIIKDNQYRYLSKILPRAESCDFQTISSLDEQAEDRFQYGVRRKNKLEVKNSDNISFLSDPRSEPCETPIDSSVKNETASVKCIHKIEENMKNTNKQMKFGIAIMLSYHVLYFALPIQSSISYLFGNSKVEDLQLSLFVLVPFTENSSIDAPNKFFVVVFVQILYIILFYKLLMDTFTMEVLSCFTLRTEIELLLIRLDDFNVKFCENQNWGTDSSLEMRQKMLLEKFRLILMHHQTVFRKVQDFNDFIGFTALYFNGSVCGVLCISIFFFQGRACFRTACPGTDDGHPVRKHALPHSPDIAFKAKYIVIYIFLIILLAQYSEEGQIITDKLEDIRVALYQLSWINMPKEMKSSLLILLIRNSNPPKITAALGFFDINRVNMSKIIRASYSYFNVLNTVK